MSKKLLQKVMSGMTPGNVENMISAEVLKVGQLQREVEGKYCEKLWGKVEMK